MRFLRRLRRIFRARRFERELAEEVRFHREMAGGAFGSVALAMEESRAVWRFAWLDSAVQDVRYALRGFRKEPGFALPVVGTLALGLGALATSFSVFNALVLRPFAVRDPYSLRQFLGWSPTKGGHSVTHVVTPGREFDEFRRDNPAFSEVLGYFPGTASMAGRGASVLAVTGNYFTMLGGRICMGRPLVDSDDAPGSSVAVASYSAWKNRLGGDPGALGRKLYLRGTPVEVVGVTCPEFNGLRDTRTDFWVSLPLAENLPIVREATGGRKRMPFLFMVGRLKRGLTAEAAETALLAYGRQMYPAWPPNGPPPQGAPLDPCATALPLNQYTRNVFLQIFAAFALILLIACANVANMMLARGLARQREIGIRISLGAGRARMIRQLLTESLLLGLAAAPAAWVVAYGTLRAAAWLQSVTPHAEAAAALKLWNVAPDLRVLAFLLAAAGVATLAFGLMPALQASRCGPAEASRGNVNGNRPGRLRNALMIAQVTVCALLLICAGIALRGERRLISQDLGMDVKGVYSIDVNAARRAAAVERLRALPETVFVAATAPVPLAQGYLPIKIETEGRATTLKMRFVSPDFFAMLGVPIRGRNFTREEGISEAPLAIISESAARAFWPNGDALGKVLNVGENQGWLLSRRAQPLRSALVIGIARDAMISTYPADQGGSKAFAYLPIGLETKTSASLLVKVNGSPEGARRAVEGALTDLTRDAGDSVTRLESVVDTYLYSFRALAAIAGFLSGIALLLTVSGVFGVASYTVTQRRREFGIRIALGAGEARVTGLVFRKSLMLAAAGAALGAVAALGVARAMAHTMQPIDVFDASGYAGGVLVVIAAAVTASWLPARQAARVDPAETLRCE